MQSLTQKSDVYNFATERVARIATMEKDVPSGISGLSVSPDGHWIIYPQIDQAESQIMLVENFR